VIGTHGRNGVRRAFLGSTAEAVIRTSDLPVLALRDPSETVTISIDRVATGTAR
jgi:Universal stress protein family